jgi:hypothetical protein
MAELEHRWISQNPNWIWQGISSQRGLPPNPVGGRGRRRRGESLASGGGGGNHQRWLGFVGDSGSDRSRMGGAWERGESERGVWTRSV